jgi:hypothetical protein
MSVLVSLWTPGDLKSAQNELAAKANAFNTSVQACTKLDTETASSWAAFYASLTQFVQTTYGWFTTTLPDGTVQAGGGTGSTADQIQSYQRELYAWGQKLSGTCTLSTPNISPTPPSDSTTLLKYGAVIVGFVGAAYMVGKVLEYVPRPARAEK